VAFSFAGSVFFSVALGSVFFLGAVDANSLFFFQRLSGTDLSMPTQPKDVYSDCCGIESRRRYTG
jgi:hypothetical protein